MTPTGHNCVPRVQRVSNHSTVNPDRLVRNLPYFCSKYLSATILWGYQMAERRLIYNAKGVQLGYLEGDVAFDLSGRQRCNYNGASGNLFDSSSERAIGHISLDGTFVGPSWISDDLFGKPTGEGYATRPVGTHGANRPRTRASAKRSDALPASPKPEQPVDNPAPDARSEFQSDNEGETDLSSSEVSDQELTEPLGPGGDAVPEPPESTSSSPPANELLSRAIGMIRDALAKEQQ